MGKQFTTLAEGKYLRLLDSFEKAKLTPEQKHEIAMAAVRARKSQVCPVCGRQIIGGANYTRHFDVHR